MATSARLLTELCTCGRAGCTCSTSPLNPLNEGISTMAASRQVIVSDKDYTLFRRTGVTPPDREGDTLDIVDLDKKLAPFDLGTRMQVKTALANDGLLRPFRP
jgi:hypothetical protein